MHLIRSGNDINVVSNWLGHADVNTTHIYVEIDMDIKRKMLQISPAPKTSKRPKTPKWQQPDILKWLEDLSRRPELCAAN